jgi:hypothetical protein
MSYGFMLLTRRACVRLVTMRRGPGGVADGVLEGGARDAGVGIAPRKLLHVNCRPQF